jgi:hypothetical protein
MAKRDAEVEAPGRNGEAGTAFCISLLFGAFGSLPTLSGVMEGTVSLPRGVMWFLITTLIAMIGVWTITWLMHVFSDPYPDGEADESATSHVSANPTADATADTTSGSASASASAPTTEGRGADTPTSAGTDRPASRPSAPAMAESP